MVKYLRVINIFKFFLSLSILYAIFIFYLSSQSVISRHIDLIEKQYILDILSFFEGLGLGVITEISIYAYSNYDKLLHFCLYTGFGIVLYLTMHFSSNAKLQKYAVLFAFIIGVSYAITDEIHQTYVPGRSGTIADLMADTAGLVFSLIITPGLIHLKSIINERIHKSPAK
ncbi:MAG: VanZ family protein [ANME-2 cluster archaeon]|jgi:VanZ family protein|nr:VanZ family protein [ANME-2 cluster archaeon]